MIKTPTKFIALLYGAALLTSSAFAQGVATDPVGYVTTTVPNGDDVVVGTPLAQAAAYAGAATSVSGAVVTFDSATFGDLTSQPHYMLVSTSASIEGDWFQVQSNTATSLTLAEDIQAAGLLASDVVKVIPFWTLDTMFADGAGVGVSPDPLLPVSFVMIPDLVNSGVNLAKSKLYFYHDGSSPFLPVAGWYDNDNVFGGVVGSTPLSPETFITIRNQSGVEQSVVLAGTVPVSSYATEIVRLANGVAQDNALVNPFPSPITLAETGLSSVIAASTDPLLPTDLVLIYSNVSGSGTNVPPSKAYLYHDGSSPFLPVAGWYDNDNVFGGVVDDTVSIPAGGAFLIRKAAGPVEAVVWAPSVPYSLAD